MSPMTGVDRRGKSRPTGIRSLDLPVRSESLYRMSYSGSLPSDKRNIKTKARMENGITMQTETDRSTTGKAGLSAIFSTTNPRLIKTQEKEKKLRRGEGE